MTGLGTRAGAATPDVPRVARVAHRTDVRRWVLLCALAEAIGMPAGAAGSLGATHLLQNDLATAWVAATLVVLGGLVEGTALGLAQSAAWRPTLPQLGRAPYVAMTLAVAGLGWAGGSLPVVLTSDDSAAASVESPPLWLVAVGGAAVGAGMGLALGAAQALVLRGAARHPWRWVPANAVAWAPAMAVMMVGASLPGEDWPPAGVLALAAGTGVLAGGLLGLALGWFAASVPGPPPHNRVVLYVLEHTGWRRPRRALAGVRVRGRLTGQVVEIPVMYAASDGVTWVAVGGSERKQWWRNVRADAPVDLLLDGQWVPVSATVVRPGDPGYDDAAGRYRERWPKARLDGSTLLVRAQPVD